MPADVKTNAYLLGNATLMMTPFGEIDPFLLTPADHSLGMVKNVTLSEESDTIELRHGIQQHLVDSRKSNVRSTVSAEVYEFNAQNLYYGLSLAKTAVAPKRGVLTAAATGASSTITIASDPLPGETATAITAITDIPVGATVLLQRPDDESDYVFPARVTAETVDATGTYTVTVEIPVGMSFPIGSKVWVVNEIAGASHAEQDYFSLKIVGTLSNNQRPVAIVFPKVKVRRGFNLTFDETNYGNMPFEFDPYFLTSAEATGSLAQIGSKQQFTVYMP